MIPNQLMDLDVDDTLQVLRAIDSLEELDDVQAVFHNLNISAEAMAALEAE
jgi:transcriptional/translational regulatory protein YebC/TACO1